MRRLSFSPPHACVVNRQDSVRFTQGAQTESGKIGNGKSAAVRSAAARKRRARRKSSEREFARGASQRAVQVVVRIGMTAGKRWTADREDGLKARLWRVASQQFLRDPQ